MTIYNPDLDPDGGHATTIASFVLDLIDRLDAPAAPGS